ncbi:MAG TPA: hypothetical protein VK846_18030 [Candidatus Limnocylindria bacterium]|nr:hypothetical protein [Candidatus Limnocylindria bacterium]
MSEGFERADRLRFLPVAGPLRLCVSAVTFVFLCFASAAYAAEEKGKVLYQNDFSKGEVGKLPEEMLLLDGGFAVQEFNGNKVLQLPGAPLDTFGVLFGPTESANMAVSARVHSSKKGRREPAFALGLNGNAGYKLQVSAAKKLVELYKGDDVIAKEPFTLESDSWTMLKLQVRKVKDGEFAVEGKVWKQGMSEPEKWTVTFTETSEPTAGRASLWGNPFAGTPIDFDDLVVSAVK